LCTQSSITGCLDQTTNQTLPLSTTHAKCKDGRKKERHRGEGRADKRGEKIGMEAGRRVDKIGRERR